MPDAVVACVGGGSNSIGMFADFIDEKEVDLIGVEAGGLGIETGKHASAMALGQVGVLHGMKTYLLQDDDGNIQLAHSDFSRTLIIRVLDQNTLTFVIQKEQHMFLLQIRSVWMH